MFGSFWAQKKHVGMGRIRGLRCEDWGTFFLGGAYREEYKYNTLSPKDRVVLQLLDILWMDAKIAEVITPK